MDREELKRLTKEEISRRIREGVKAVIVLRTAYANEQVLEEEMTEHLAAGYRERTPSRRGERNGYYTREPHHAGGQDRPAPGTPGPGGDFPDRGL
jgi:transposase-like protein